MMLTGSERFNATDAGTVLLSSDDVQFKVHFKNLEVHSDFFADSRTISDRTHIQLSEPSTVVDLLLQFMYRQPQPNLGEVEFTIMSQVAEAAEKYRVHSAITGDTISDAIAGHAAEVLAYAVKHNHCDIADAAAPSVLDVPIEHLLSTFTDLRLLQLWRSVLEFAHNNSYVSVFHNGVDCGAPRKIGKAVVKVLNNLGANPASLRKLDEKFHGPEDIVRDCESCREGISYWHTRTQERLHKIPKFSSFM